MSIARRSRWPSRASPGSQAWHEPRGSRRRDRGGSGDERARPRQACSRASLPRPPVLVKPVFAAGDNPPIRAALEATGRHTVVAVGLETDVCVAHSAISLMERGYHVAAVSDALFSPGAAHAHGLDGCGRGRAAALGQGAVLRLGAHARGRAGAGPGLSRAGDAARLLALMGTILATSELISGTTEREQLDGRQRVRVLAEDVCDREADLVHPRAGWRGGRRASSPGSTETIVVFSISS